MASQAHGRQLAGLKQNVEGRNDGLRFKNALPKLCAPIEDGLLRGVPTPNNGVFAHVSVSGAAEFADDGEEDDDDGGSRGNRRLNVSWSDRTAARNVSTLATCSIWNAVCNCTMSL